VLHIGIGLASIGNNVLATWYTVGDEGPEVRISLSEDSGNNFSSAKRIDKGNPLGRVDASFIDENRIVVTWMEDIDSVANILLTLWDKQFNLLEEKVVDSVSNSRASGFPRIATMENKIYVSWTKGNTESSKVATTEILLND